MLYISTKENVEMYLSLYKCWMRFSFQKTTFLQQTYLLDKYEIASTIYLISILLYIIYLTSVIGCQISLIKVYNYTHTYRIDSRPDSYPVRHSQWHPFDTSRTLHSETAFVDLWVDLREEERTCRGCIDRWVGPGISRIYRSLFPLFVCAFYICLSLSRYKTKTEQ